MLYKTNTDECALVHNQVILHTVDSNFPEDGTTAMLETLAERLAEATEEGLMLVDVDAVHLPTDWNWEGVVNGQYGTNNPVVS